MDRTYTEADISGVAGEMLAQLGTNTGATIMGLSGDLGAGKTTLVQAIARGLGVADTVTSPTFVIAKYYNTQDVKFKKLIHIDAYRIEDPQELLTIGWNTMKEEHHTLIVIEWPEKVEALLPENTKRFMIGHTLDSRHIKNI